MSVKILLFGVFFNLFYEKKLKLLQMEYVILLKGQIMHFVLEECNWNQREKYKLI